MIAEQGKVMNKIKASKRLIAVIVVGLLIVGANALLTKRSKPFQRLDSYQSAAQLIEGKNWNWGLAFLVRGTQGEVSLNHLGTLEYNGIFIPEELAQVNRIEVDSSESPIALSLEDSLALRAVEANSVVISKTRCLYRDSKYCDVRIMSNASINPLPKTFIGVHLSANVFGLVEKQILETVIGTVNRCLT